MAQEDSERGDDEDIEKADPSGEQVVVATMTPSGPQEVASLPSHVNESTAMRNSGAAHVGLYGGSGPSAPHQTGIV